MQLLFCSCGWAGLGHADDGEGGAVRERDFDAFDDVIAAGQVERDAGESGSHFKAGKAGSTSGRFAGIEDFGAEAAAGPIGVNEEGADFGGIDCGIEEICFANGSVVAAEEGFAMAPAAAAGQDSGARRACFGDEIGAVGDELSVEAEERAERAFDLCWSVVVSLQAADGGFDQRVKRGLIGVGGQAQGEADVRHAGENRTAKRVESVADQEKKENES